MNRYYFYFLIFLEYEANVGNQYCTLQKYVTHYNSEAEIRLMKMVCKWGKKTSQRDNKTTDHGC